MAGNDKRTYLQPDVLANISDLELRARLAVEGFVSGMHRSPYHGYSVEFAQHKEYVAGDDLRHLDWRVLGRSDRLYVKQYEEETNLRTHLILDTSLSMRYPEADGKTPRLTKFEYGATLVACLAYLLTHQQDGAGLMLFDEKVKADMPPLTNMGHLRQVIGRLEAARLEKPSDDGAVFRRIASRLQRRSMAVVISDLLIDPEIVIPTLQQMRFGGHEVLVFHILDEDERSFPFMDNTEFVGLEAPDEKLTADPQALKRAYLAALDEFETKLRRACTNSRIDFVPLSTATPLDVALRSYLAARLAQVKAAR